MTRQGQLPGIETKRRTLSLAVLTPAEENVWLSAFEYALLHGKQSGTEAARRAWNEVIEQFPRLKSYDGAKP